MDHVEANADVLMTLFIETRAHRANVEEVFHGLVGGHLTLPRYREALGLIYGFEAPLEAALAYTPGLSTILDPPRRSGLIVRDLLALELRPGEIAVLPQCGIAPFASPAIALGWLYVYERFRLQHPIVCARVLEQLPDARGASEYFCTDEVEAGRRWDQFTSALERFPTSDADRKIIVEAAIDAFTKAAEWYRDEPMRVAQ